MKLPPEYEWLTSVADKPKILVEALTLYGIHESAGVADNPLIITWAKECGLENTYRHDSTPWCGLFLALVAQRAGKEVPKDPLWALNWKRFGIEAPQDCLGEVLVFSRDGGGHVGLYVGEDAEAFHVLGGNTRDMVTIARISRQRCVGWREPPYKIRPAGARRFALNDFGELSRNEK